MLKTLSLTLITGSELLQNADLLSELSELFSTNYGIWLDKGPRPGQLVTMGVKKMKELLLFDVEACGVVVARLSESSRVVAHAFYYKFKTESLGNVCWITQLVVCGAVRHRGISTSMIRAVLKSDDFSVCGLVTSHPYAICALEKAASCKCDRAIIQKYSSELIKKCGLPYIDPQAVVDVHGSINTEFYVDHTELLEIIQRERDDCKWIFGDLLDGHEFFVFVFMKLNKENHESQV